MAERAYFNRFPAFEPDSQATLIENFRRLSAWRKWKQNSKRCREEERKYLNALAETHIGGIEEGGAVEQLVGLQRLCDKLGISPIPASITQCKKVSSGSSGLASVFLVDRIGQRLQTIHVCIIDLIDSQRLGTPVHVLSSHHALKQHIRAKKHFFPKDEAKEKADGLLRVLLREILR